MEDLSKGEFLSFLYSEKSREIENNSAPGWNIWAIGGIIVSLVIFGYKILVNNNLDSDIVTLYFFVALAWILANLHLIFTFSHRVFSSRKVRRLIEEAPLTLCIIKTMLSLIEFYISISLGLIVYSALWGVFTVINFAVVFYICFCRNKIVPAGLKTDIFTNDKYNVMYNLILVFVYGLMGNFQFQEIKTHGFYRNEFEFVIILSCLIIAICKLINITQRNKIAEGLDDIIELFTSGFIDQKGAYKRYVYLMYGKDVLQILEDDINELPKIEEECISIREQLRVFLNRIEKNTLSVDEINGILETLKDCCDFQKKTLKKLDALNKRCNEVLSLNMPRIITSEFGDVLLNIKKLVSLLGEILIKCEEVDSALKDYIDTHLYCKKTGGVCEKIGCMYRNESMAWTYRFKLWLYKLLHKNNKDR